MVFEATVSSQELEKERGERIIRKKFNRIGRKRKSINGGVANGDYRSRYNEEQATAINIVIKDK